MELFIKVLWKLQEYLGEIWAHLFGGINLNIAKLLQELYCYVCMVEGDALYYHLTKFDNNCIGQSENMDRKVKKTLTGG